MNQVTDPLWIQTRQEKTPVEPGLFLDINKRVRISLAHTRLRLRATRAAGHEGPDQ